VIVAIWNTPDRIAEYMPRKALSRDRDGDVPSGVAGGGPIKRPILSDSYLRFIVEELKPFIDGAYRTRLGREDTFIMGSSMGALISLYAVLEYPLVFGGAACISTHWPAGDSAMVPYLARVLPRPGRHRFYFDHGTATLDSLYPPLQATVDQSMRAAGYVAGVD
jgi:predicted alpha/beta superfamily hydrolase